jgi:hypothetical protein
VYSKQAGKIADRTQIPASAIAVGEPLPFLALTFTVVVCVAGAALWLWFTSPKPHYNLNIVVPGLVLLVGGVVVPMLFCFVGGAFGLFKVDIYRSILGTGTQRRHVRSRRSRYYRFAVLFTVVAMLSIMFHVPLYARFALSRPSMVAFIANVQENPDAVRPATMRVGLFDLETKPQQHAPGALMFHLAGDSEAGFTYSAAPIGYPGRNKGSGGSLGGGWYWFSDD